MQSIRTIIYLLILGVGFSLTACTHIFETSADVQARQALLDLMKIQETFHKEHGRYAKNLVEIDKYGLQYHSGIVYMEIPYAKKDQYRAISLPAESTTARVFAYETSRGGFYEMDEEVPEYVLGALSYIRSVQQQQKVQDFLSALLVALLAGMGIKSLTRENTGKFRTLHAIFFLSLIPLCCTLAILNHMNKETVFSSLLLGVVAGCLLISGFCLTACGKAVVNHIKNRGPAELAGLFFSMIVTSSLSIAVIVHTLIKYYNA